MSKSFKKFVAIVSAIAMVVTSLTVYNSKTTSADTDYSSLTYNYKLSGTTFLKGSETTKVPWKVAIDQSQSQGEIVNWMTTGAGELNFYNDMFMKVVWHGNYPKAVLEINGKTVEQGGEGVQAFADAEVHVNAKAWIENNAYNVVKVTSADASQWVTFIVATGDKASNGETTKLQKPSKPEGLSANINDLKTNYTIAWADVSGATSYKFYVDGACKKDIRNGDVVTIEELGLTAGQTYTFGVSAVNAAGESDPATISVTVPSVEETTTSKAEVPVESTTPAEAFDPSTITEWTAVTNSTTLSYYIADGADARVSVKPEMHGDNLYVAFKIAAKFSSVTLNDEAITPREGADVEIAKTSFVEGYNKLVVVDYYGKESVTIYVKAEKEEETTTKAYVDGEVLVNESNVTKDVPAYTGGDYWQNSYTTDAPVTYVAGKKYVAEVVVSSTATKKIKLVFQRVDNWNFVDAASGYETEIAAGNKVKITYVFDAIQSTDNGNFAIYLGSVADATTLVFESKKLTTYNEVPEGVVTGVEVLSTPTTTEYGVTVDSVKQTIIDGKVTLPTDAKYGYYCAGKMYKPGAEVTVTSDMAFTSVKNLSVSISKGAGIRIDGTSGIRFKAKVTTDNNAALESGAITEGMLITASDLRNGANLTLDSKYKKIEITNDGWYKNEVGTYCGSIINIAEGNYARAFVARSYVIINYEDGTSRVEYSENHSEDRSIAQVAKAVQADTTAYSGLGTAQKAMIDKYARAATIQ